MGVDKDTWRERAERRMAETLGANQINMIAMEEQIKDLQKQLGAEQAAHAATRAELAQAVQPKKEPEIES